MKLHFFTLDTAAYSYERFIEVMDDADFDLQFKQMDINDILNSDDVLSILETSGFTDDLLDLIDPLFDTFTNGTFDWNKKTDEYYDLVADNVSDCICRVERDSGEVLKQYNCVHNDSDFTFANDSLMFNLPYFYTGNGEPAGAQLALNLVDIFMKSGQWHIGMYDSDNKLITNIPAWAKENNLDIKTIKPIVWFGREDYISECWSVTPGTQDLFIKTFWEDYYEGALPYICKANEGLGIYYSVWEYGLEYDYEFFDNIKLSCPINLDLPNEERSNALYNLVISIYNNNKA